jgi:CTP synthase
MSGMGGTMRLGKFDCQLQSGSKAHQIYTTENISERHRHRYEFNNNFTDEFIKNGMLFSGINRQGKLVEIIELKDHPWFMGVQFHPEYKSTVANPHPLFVNFIKAAIQYSDKKKGSNSKDCG